MMRLPRISMCVTVLFLIPEILSSQDVCNYVHPPEPPKASDFIQPPADGKLKFVGPMIRQVQVACWHAEPNDSTKCIGGVHGFQRVQSFLPTDVMVRSESVNTDYRQGSTSWFSAGGAKSEIKSEDLPPGIFFSFKGHPIFKVVKVQFPTKAHDSPFAFSGELKTGASVEIDFSHEPSNGECYLYVAVWVAVK